MKKNLNKIVENQILKKAANQVYLSKAEIYYIADKNSNFIAGFFWGIAFVLFIIAIITMDF